MRGSVSVANWLADAKFVQTKCDGIVPKGFCSIGFLNFWNESKQKAMEGIKNAVVDHLDYDFIVTGHSLGGAAAVYATIEMRKLNGVKNVTMVTIPLSQAIRERNINAYGWAVYLRPTPRWRRNPHHIYHRIRLKLPRHPHL